MIETYLKARKLAASGNFEGAWEIAKDDETLNEGVTKKQWIAFVKKSLKQR